MKIYRTLAGRVDEFFKKGGSNMATAFGKTDPADWKQAPGSNNSIYIDIKVPAGTFAGSNPVIYTTSIGGDNQQWSLLGANAVYKATNDGCRVYIKWVNGAPLNRDYAEHMNWHINWIAMQA